MNGKFFLNMNSYIVKRDEYMKKQYLVIIVVILMLVVPFSKHLYDDGTNDFNYSVEERVTGPKFKAVILKINGKTALVEPMEGIEKTNCNKLTFEISHLDKLNIKKGDGVEITFTGIILETCPGKIQVTNWKKIHSDT